VALPDDRVSSAPNDDADQAMNGTIASEQQGEPRGAMLIAAIAVGTLLVGWLLFYFLLFMRRGYIG
jgi:F0F1-type ATP synthase assembly protein I